MRTAVVYESMFGNTHHVAEAIAEGLRGSGEGTFDNDTSEIDRAREWGRAVGLAAAARLGLVAG